MFMIVPTILRNRTKVPWHPTCGSVARSYLTASLIPLHLDSAGRWNCDKDPNADTSSFMETLIPMVALAIRARVHDDESARQAGLRASEVFLNRRLFKRQSDATVIDPQFVQLHYPLYWHYDVLGGLKGMAELSLIRDPRCSLALDLLEQKELEDGGWPAEGRYYRVSDTIKTGAEYVDWGGCSKKRMNEWVTADALRVLRTATSSFPASANAQCTAAGTPFTCCTGNGRASARHFSRATQAGSTRLSPSLIHR